MKEIRAQKRGEYSSQAKFFKLRNKPTLEEGEGISPGKLCLISHATWGEKQNLWALISSFVQRHIDLDVVHGSPFKFLSSVNQGCSTRGLFAHQFR